MEVDIGGLRAFVVVAELGRFGSAADELGISQQAVSKRISRLEDTFGVQLFRRRASGTELTAEGSIALAHARTVVEAVERFTAAVRPRDRPLRVDVLGTRLSTVGLIRSFHDSRESTGERDIEIVTSDGLRSAVPALLRGEIDAAYARVSGLDDPQLASTPAYLEPAHVIVGPRHRLAGRRHVSPAELGGAVAWMPGNTPGSEWAEYWDEFATRFGVGVESGRTFFGMDHLFEEIAASQDLVTFAGEVTPTHVPWHLELSRVAIVDPVPVYPISLIWSRGSRHALLAELVAHTRRRYRPPVGEIWTPEVDRARFGGRAGRRSRAGRPGRAAGPLP